MAWREVKKNFTKQEQTRWQPKWVANQKKWQPKWKTKDWSSPTLWVKECDPGTKVDGETRYTGTVRRYDKWKGAGCIDIDEAGVVADNRVFVHWSNLQTGDRFPFLIEGMQVEFGLMVWKFAKKTDRNQEAQVRAKYVTHIGGELLAVQDVQDAEKKIFVGGQSVRYTGRLEYYDPKEGIGRVTMDDGFSLAELVPKSLLVEEPEVHAGGKKPQKMSGLQVEFGIWKNNKGQYKVYNMTLPDSLPLTRENLEKRQLAGRRMFHGTICQWWWKQGWGFISPQSTAEYPALVIQKLTEMQAAAQRKANGRDVPQVLYFCQKDIQKGFNPKKGNACMFQLYTDDKGVGATNIQ